jgi:hypothetical protein
VKKALITGLFIFSAVSLEAQVASDSVLSAAKDSSLALMRSERMNVHHDSTKHWQLGGDYLVNISQIWFINWVAGGQNTFAGNTLLKTYLLYSTDSLLWENTLKVALGMVKQANTDRINKSDDRIDFTSRYTRKSTKNWEFSTVLNFKTQALPGYEMVKDSAGNETETKISSFMAPAYTILSLGYSYKPNKNFMLLIAPLTGKLTIVIQEKLSDISSFVYSLVSFEENYKAEFGGFIQWNAKATIHKNFSIESTLELFSNYLSNPQYIDVDWEMVAKLKISKYFAANLKTNLVYDHDILTVNEEGIAAPRVQFKQFAGIGLSYSF